MGKNTACFYQRGTIEIVEGEGTHEFPYHSHESFLIGVVESGAAKFVIGEYEYTVAEGMTYFVPPHVGMSISPIKPYSYLTICIKKGPGVWIEQNKSGIYVLQNLGDRVINLCKRFRLNKLTEDEFIRELAESLELRTDNHAFDNNANKDMQNAVNYIKEHVTDKFLLDDLAQAVHLSKYHLIRVFKKEMGVTPKQYDQQCKIRQAKNGILSMQAEADIAMDLSYANQSHLCSMFRRYMGISMSEYKNSMTRDEQ